MKARRNIVTEGDIAIIVIDAVRLALANTNVSTKLSEWYVSSQQEQYGPHELDSIPVNRRFGVKAKVELSSLKISLFWDRLEESVTTKDESNGKKICEINTSRFRTKSDFRDRINAAVEAAVDQSILYSQNMA